MCLIGLNFPVSKDKLYVGNEEEVKSRCEIVNFTLFSHLGRGKCYLNVGGVQEKEVYISICHIKDIVEKVLDNFNAFTLI